VRTVARHRCKISMLSRIVGGRREVAVNSGASGAEAAQVRRSTLQWGLAQTGMPSKVCPVKERTGQSQAVESCPFIKIQIRRNTSRANRRDRMRRNRERLSAPIHGGRTAFRQDNLERANGRCSMRSARPRSISASGRCGSSDWWNASSCSAESEARHPYFIHHAPRGATACE